MTSIIPRPRKKSRRGDRKLLLDAALPPLAMQHIWYEMARRREWTSLALVPTTDNISVLEFAHGIGLMAVREPHDLIWVVNASSKPNDQVTERDVNAPGQEERGFPYKFVDLQSLGVTPEKQLITAEMMIDKYAENEDEQMRFIFAVNSVLDNTYPISLCRKVDAVILCISLGRTSFKDVRRTVEIIGEEQIMGSIVLKPKSPNRAG